MDLQGKAPADLAWSPTGGRLYFVLGSTELWKIESGHPPQKVCEGPPQDSLKAVTVK